MLFRSRFRQTRFAEALQDYDQAIALLPDHAPSYHARGLTYRRLGETDKAIADFQRVVATASDPSLIAGARSQLQELGVQ